MLHHGRRGILSRGASPTKSYNGNVTVTPAAGATTATFAGVSFGTAATDRVVVVYVHAASGNLTSITSVTIAGVSATLAVQANASAQVRPAAIYYAAIPTGTSGTVVVNYSSSQGSQPNYCFSYSLYGLSSNTPTSTQVSNNDATGVSPTASVTFTPSSGGVLIAGYNAGGVAAGTNSTWTNATEDADFIWSGSNILTTASEANMPSASRTVTCTGTDTSVNRPNLILAAWR